MPKGKIFNPELQKLRNKLPQEGFFSTLDELIEAAPQDRMTAKQWKEYLSPGRTLTREGVTFPLKKEEVEYALGNWLKDPSVDPNQMIQREYIQGLAREQRPEIERQGMRSVTGGNFNQYSTQGPNRLDYFETQTESPDFGEFRTHFTPHTLSWSRGSRHSMDPNYRPSVEDMNRGVPPTGGVLRLIDEIQSDRHSAAAEKVRRASEGRELESGADVSLGGLPEGHGQTVTRRGYRTPEQEQRLLDFRRRPGNTQLMTEEYRNLDVTPPDAPFKDPADYGRLEIKKGILDAIERGDQYVGVTPSEGPIDWFGLNSSENRWTDGDEGFGDSPEAKGMQYSYDKVYPGELRKIAQQYGAPMTELDLPVMSSKPQKLPILEEEGVDLPDHLQAIRDGQTPQEMVADYHDLLTEFEDALSPEPGSDLEKSFDKLQELINELEGVPDDSDIDESEINQMFYDLEGILSTQTPKTQINRKVPAMELTPEIVEKIKKAGIPLWAITGGVIGLDQLMGEEEQPAAFSVGGAVDPQGNDEEQPPARQMPGGVGVLKKIAEFVDTDDPEKYQLAHQLLAGLLSQTHGFDEDRNVKFLGYDSRRSGTGKVRPNIVNDTLAAPADMDSLVSLMQGRIDPETGEIQNHGWVPEVSKIASGESQELQDAMDEILGLDPMAEVRTPESVARMIGTMIGQIPVPGRAAATAGKAAVTAGKGILHRLKEVPHDFLDFFGPTVSPGSAGYLKVPATMATATSLASKYAGRERDPESRRDMNDFLSREESIGYAEGGKVEAAVSTLDDMMNYLRSSRGSPQMYAEGGSVQPTRYVGTPKTEAELLNYGSGPEARFFEHDTTPLNVDFSKTGPVGGGAPAASSGGNNTNAIAGILGSLPAAWKGLGYADKFLGTGMQDFLKDKGMGALDSIKGWLGTNQPSSLGQGVGTPAPGELSSLAGYGGMGGLLSGIGSGGGATGLVTAGEPVLEGLAGLGAAGGGAGAAGGLGSAASYGFAAPTTAAELGGAGATAGGGGAGALGGALASGAMVLGTALPFFDEMLGLTRKWEVGDPNGLVQSDIDGGWKAAGVNPNLQFTWSEGNGLVPRQSSWTNPDGTVIQGTPMRPGASIELAYKDLVKKGAKGLTLEDFMNQYKSTQSHFVKKARGGRVR